MFSYVIFCHIYSVYIYIYIHICIECTYWKRAKRIMGGFLPYETESATQGMKIAWFHHQQGADPV